MPLDAGKKTVTTSGTPEALAASQRVGCIYIQALGTNTKDVWIGGKTTVNASTKTGTRLKVGEVPIKFNAGDDKVQDLAEVFVDPEVNGEGVSFSYGHMP